MANFVAIRSDKHQNLKISQKRNLAHVANQHIITITASEYAQSSASFPIVLVKNPDSPRYRSVAMLGIEAGENVYYQDDKWSALSVPQSIGMAPFALGLDPEKENTLTACVDVDSEFVGEDKDLALFEAEGKESELLTNVQNSLGRLYENEKMTESFIKELDDNDLLQELELKIDLSTGEKKKLTGLFTVNEDKIKSLADDKVLDFHKRGLFVPIYAMLGSLSQINRLVQLRNQNNEVQVTSIKIEQLAKQEAQTES
jgi:hypothetical protein